MPQHRSATSGKPARRAARCLASGSAEACSSPSRVNHMRPASGNLAAALVRSSRWARAAATSSAGNRSRSRVPNRKVSASASGPPGSSASSPRPSADSSQSRAPAGSAVGRGSDP
jgi:hypothetical protein